jgi:hypothetical protein
MLSSMAFALIDCSLNPTERTPMTTRAINDPQAPTRRKVRIELLALDLAMCGRCTRTDRNLEAALRAAASSLCDKHIDVEVAKHVVTSEQEAERLRFASSPTIRVDGQDIALALRESPCEDCGELRGCAVSVNCRVRVWKGREHLEAPTGMIVEATLRAAESPSEESGPVLPYQMPKNLRTFFSALSRKEGTSALTGSRVSCCGPATQSECCGTGS